MKSYTFIIDTNQYAGNFERQMCAYMTGMIGDCGVGEEYAEMYKNCGLSPMKELLTYKSDEHGTYRPCGIFPTPGWINNGYSHYRIDNLDEEKALAEYNENVEKEAKKIESQIYQGEDAEYSKKQADQYRKNYKRDKLQKWPAYNSVGIYMVARPTDKEIALLKERAHAFTLLKSKHPWEDFSSISIEGFRLLVETTSSHLEAI